MREYVDVIPVSYAIIPILLNFFLKS